jgi:hypothetical protein
MPTVLREGPYRFYWYSHEPEPPHVHVDRGDYSGSGCAPWRCLFRGQYTHFCGRLCFFADSAPVSLRPALVS